MARPGAKTLPGSFEALTSVVILSYHTLDCARSPISTPPDVFRRQMDFLAEAEIPVVPLEEVQRTPDAVALTFDDAFASFAEHALPVLAAHRFMATLFVVSGYAGRTNAWPSQPGGIPISRLLSWSALDDCLRAGMSIGAHTVNHPFLPGLSDVAVREEMQNCRTTIEDRLGAPVRSFAYPYGAWNQSVRACAEPYFNLACTTDMRRATAADDPLALPRIDAYYLRRLFWFERLQQPSGRAWLSVRAGLRQLRSRVAG